MGKIRTLKDRTPTLRAQRLRREDTEAEARLWGSLRDRRLGGWKWRRQVPRGPYIVDFTCIEARLVVELDGSQHAENVAYDERRTGYLERFGLRVLRFWNSEILTNSDGVCLAILEACGGEQSGFGEPVGPRPTNGRD